MLGVSWEGLGTVLGGSWEFFFLLGKSWESLGSVLGESWEDLGEVLGGCFFSWESPGRFLWVAEVY